MAGLELDRLEKMKPRPLNNQNQSRRGWKPFELWWIKDWKNENRCERSPKRIYVFSLIFSGVLAKFKS